jgi:Fic family protein
MRISRRTGWSDPLLSASIIPPQAMLHPLWHQAIDADKARLDAARPLPQHTVASLRDKLVLEWTYHSNAIEGNTLTLRETKVVLEGITVGGKSLREHFEAINHRDAILFVEQVVAGHEPLSEAHIKDIHSLVLKGIDADEAGRYRRENVVIAGASTTPPDFLHLNDEMRALLAWYQQAGTLHAVERAAQLHTRFVKIHPFIDGNGRTGRLLLNLELMKSGYPPAVIRKEDRLAYYDALDEACVSGDHAAITTLVAESVQRSLRLYLDLLPAPG